MLAILLFLEILRCDSVVFSQQVMDRGLLMLRNRVGWTIGQCCMSAVDHPCVMRPMVMQQASHEPMSIAMIVFMLMMLMKVLLHRFHFEDQVASSDIGVVRVKDAAIRLKCPTLLLPAVLVKPLEVISPQEVKLVLLIIVAIHFNIVKQDIPWHILCSQLSAPCVESGRPEVHFQVLGLVHELDCLVIVSIEVAHHITIHDKSNMAGRPLDLVGMPVSADCVMVLSIGVGVVLSLVVAVAIDGIG